MAIKPRKSPTARPVARQQTKDRNVLAISLSIGAFALSLFTFYYGFLHQEDYLAAIISEGPIVEFEGDDVSVSGSVSVTIVNRGTRAAAFVDGSLVVTDERLQRDEVPRRPTDAKCYSSQVAVVGLDFEPFVLGAKEITIKKLAVKWASPRVAEWEWKRNAEGIERSEARDGRVLVKRQWISEKGVPERTTVCLALEMSTPDHTLIAASLPLRHKYSRDGENAPLYHSYRPTVLFRRPANWISALIVGQEGIAGPVWEILEMVEEMKRLAPDNWGKALEEDSEREQENITKKE